MKTYISNLFKIVCCTITHQYCKTLYCKSFFTLNNRQQQCQSAVFPVVLEVCTTTQVLYTEEQHTIHSIINYILSKVREKGHQK